MTEGMPIVISEEKDERAKFPIPSWASAPPPGSHLDVLKGDQLIQKLMIDEKKAYYFGRNSKQVDFVVEHASCSRVHTILLYHSALKRFAIVDMESSHGTFVGKIRLEPLKTVFIEIGDTFHLGASTRRYVLRQKLDKNKEDDEKSAANMPRDNELENLTEYNTALNRRIPQIPITPEEARRKKRPRGNVTFDEDEQIINPEDVDPSIGRFRNLVSTAVISSNPAKRSFDSPQDHSEVPKKITRPMRDNPSRYATPGFSSLGGMVMNSAPDLDHLYNQGPSEANRVYDDDAPHKKKYAKEAWPGRKPPIASAF